MDNNIKILLVSHRPFKIPYGEYFIPIHAGRKIALQESKDGHINSTDYQWMLENTIGDDNGDNISNKNRYYSECTALYYAWKNYSDLGNPDYIGLMHYRRHFIFDNSYFETKEKSKLETALAYTSENFIDKTYIQNIGLNNENIKQACSNYDMIVSKDSDLSLINNCRNVREDYAKTIAGAKAEDFDLMIRIVSKLYPEYSEVMKKGISGYKKSLYQMFIMRKEIFFEYSEFLFSVLFELEKQTDFSDYSINGKRSLGYLAELLLAIFVWKKEEDNKIKILKLGCTLVEYPFEEAYLSKIVNDGCPKLSKYIYYKSKSLLLRGTEKQINKEIYQKIRNQRKSYFKLKKIFQNT